MPIQLAMVGLVVSDMKRSLEFYRRLGLDDPVNEDEKRFVMHRMASGVTIFFDSVFFPENDPERRPTQRGLVQHLTRVLCRHARGGGSPVRRPDRPGHVGRKAPWKSVGPYAAIVEDPDGNPDPDHGRGSRRRDLSG